MELVRVQLVEGRRTSILPHAHAPQANAYALRSVSSNESTECESERGLRSAKATERSAYAFACGVCACGSMLVLSGAALRSNWVAFGGTVRHYRR